MTVTYLSDENDETKQFYDLFDIKGYNSDTHEKKGVADKRNFHTEFNRSIFFIVFKEQKH